MSLIDTTYFVGDILIPKSSTVGLNDGLVNAINLYEEEVLDQTLGYKLHKQMKNAVNAYELALMEINPPSQPVLDSKWNKLINGGEFTFSFDGETITEYWKGLKNASKTSLIAYYVYYCYRRNNASQFNGLTETISYQEHSRTISPYVKMVSAWNNFVELYGEADFISGSNSGYIHFNANPSAYNFLLANLSDYPDWKFTQEEKINNWGI